MYGNYSQMSKNKVIKDVHQKNIDENADTANYTREISAERL